MLLELLLSILGIVPETGWMSQYAPGMMEATLKVRVYDLEHITRDEVRQSDIFVAVVDCARIGETGYISINDSPWERYLVIDCRERHITDDWFERSNIIVEVGGRAAERHGVAGVGGVRVSMFNLN